MGWLVAASLFFYGWWFPPYLALLLVSVVFNFGAGLTISRAVAPARHRLLIAAVVCNLVLLGYFKYAGFLVGVADGVLGRDWPIPVIALPLGISFFTLTDRKSTRLN